MPKPRVIYEAKPGSPIAVDRAVLRPPGRARPLADPGRAVRGARCARAAPGRSGRPALPHRRGGGAAGRRLQRVEPPQPARALLGRAHQAAPSRARHDLRPPLVLPAVPPADADDHQRHDPLRARRGRRRAATTCSAPAAIRTCTSCSTARTSISAATRTWCARSRRTGLTELDVHDVLNVFQVTGLTPDDRYFVKAEPGEEGRLLRVLRRDRRALRDLDLPPRRPLGARCGAPSAATRSRPAARSGWRSGSRIRRCSRAGGRPPPPTIAGTTVSRRG